MKRTFLGIFAILVIYSPQTTFAQVYGPAYNPYGTSSITQPSYGGTAYPDDTRCPSIAQNLFVGLRDVYTGGDIYRLQTFLISEGLLASDSATGYFGLSTRSALSRFQSSVGIYPNSGRLGPITRSAIARRCGSGTATPYPQPNPGAEYTPPTSCRAWYDGCNTCSRMSPGAQAACTLMYCPVKSAGYCTAYFSSGSTGVAPSISSFSGPVTLAVGQQGTWTIIATDPQSTYTNQQLTYDITWGDEGMLGYTLAAPSFFARPVSQQTTYTHTYTVPGTYTVRITVRNAAGHTAQSTATVTVGSGYGYGTNIRVTQPNTFGTFSTGSALPIAWTDSNTYIAAPRYDIFLRSQQPQCVGTICPLAAAPSLYLPEYSYTIATNQYGNSYSWTIPSNIPSGNYVIEVCPNGSGTYSNACDRSDTYITIQNSGSGMYPTATLFLNPSAGNTAPLTTQATITLGLDPYGYSVCGSQTYGTIEWGDGASDTVTYLGCSGTTVTIPLSHTFTRSGTFTVRLIRLNQTVVQIPVTVGTGTSSSTFTQLSVQQSAVARGGQQTIQWSTQHAPSGSAVGLELIDATTGTSYGYVALSQAASSGSFVWTVPAQSTAVIADTPYVQGSSAIDNKSVYIRARLYTPSNACFGYCAPGNQPTTVTTYNSSSFTIGNTQSTGTPTLSATTSGTRAVSITTTTPAPGTTCASNGTLVLDYGDGTAVPISSTFSGTAACQMETRTFTYTYGTSGTKTISVRNNVYPYTVYVNRTLQVQ